MGGWRGLVGGVKMGRGGVKWEGLRWGGGG